MNSFKVNAEIKVYTYNFDNYLKCHLKFQVDARSLFTLILSVVTWQTP